MSQAGDVRSQHKPGTSEFSEHKPAGWKLLFAFTRWPHLPILCPAILLSCAGGLLQPVAAIYFGRLFNCFLVYGAGLGEHSAFMHEAMKSVYAIIAIGIGTIFLKGTMFTCWLQFGEVQARFVRQELFRALLAKDLEWFECRTIGVEALLVRMQTQIHDLQLATSQPMGFSFLYIVQAFAALLLAFLSGSTLTLVILASIPIAVLGVILISRNLQENTLHHSDRLTQGIRVATQAISNIVTIKCSNTQTQEGDDYSGFVNQAAALSLKLGFSNALRNGFARFISTAMFVQGFWYGGSQILSNKMTAGQVMTTIWSCMTAVKSLEEFLTQAMVLQRGRAAALALQTVLDKFAKDKASLTIRNGHSPRFCDGEVEFCSVSFSYPSNPGNLVLRKCDIRFLAGGTTFLVGKSGGGKSSLSSVLLGFYQPSHGRVFIDGHDMQVLDTSWLRNNITLVLQNCQLFNETIFTNLALGRKDPHRVTFGEVIECLNAVSLKSTVANLPEGVMTKVGMGGSSLSGGQKQRIALARARLRDTPILILDEATSALDYHTRTAVMISLRKWRQGKTTIVITHDLSQIGDEDLVYVLDAGTVVQQGRRKQLTHLANPSAINAGKGPRLSPFTAEQEQNYQKADPGNRVLKPGVELRRGSFDAVLDANILNPPEMPCVKILSSETSRTFPRSILVGVEGALEYLKRQSIIRAKAYYDLPLPSPSIFTRSMHHVTARHDIANGMIGSPAHTFLPKTDSIDIDSKPLPIPPGPNEPGRRVAHASFVHQGEHSLSALAILRTMPLTVDPRQRVYTAIAVVATLVHACAPPVISYILAEMFSVFYLGTEYKQKLLIYSLAILGIAVADAACYFAKEFLFHCVAQGWVDTLRRAAFERILRQPKGWFDQESNSTSMVVSALDRNAEDMKDLVDKFAAQVLVVSFMMFLAATWSFVTCWKLALVSLSGGPVIYLLGRAFEVVASRWESRTHIQHERIGATFVETFANIKTVRALTLEPYFHRKYRSATNEGFSTGRRRAMICGVFYGISDSSIHFLTSLMFWYGANLANGQEWPVKSILTVFTLILFCTANAAAILTYIPQVSGATKTATRLLHLARLPLQSHEEQGTGCFGKNGLEGPIHFINQTFNYPTRAEAPALQRLNLTIAHGKCTAIVGPSGSGKSTITALILGLYSASGDENPMLSTQLPESPPSLTFSGRDVRTLNINTLRSMIAIVPQTPVLLSGTVRDNILYGLPEDSVLRSATKVEEAARRADIHEFIQSLPQGYATVIGEGGRGVSGGQAQRIVVARALVRDPQILILDEATSALDHESASIIRNSVVRLLKDKDRNLTVIVVTHSHEMMKFADQVVVLEHGTAAEQGSYADLVKARGKLWEMLKASGDLT